MDVRTVIAVIAAIVAAASAWSSWRSADASEHAYQLQRTTAVAELIQAISPMSREVARGTIIRLCKAAPGETAEAVAEAISQQSCAELTR